MLEDATVLNRSGHHILPQVLLYGGLAIGIGAVLGFSIQAMPVPWLPLLGFAAVAMAALCLVKPEVGLYFLVFVIYARVSDVLVNVHDLPSLAKPLIPFLVLVVAIRRVLYSEKTDLLNIGTFFMLGYGLIGLTSLWTANDPDRAMEALSLYVKDVAIALIVLALLKKEIVLRRVMWTLVGVGIFLGSIATFQQVTGTLDSDYFGFGQAKIAQITEDADDAPRISGPGLDPNGFAQIMLFVFPLALYLFWEDERAGRWGKLIAGWAVAVILITIIFTFSRSAFLALVFTLGLMLWRRPPNLPTIFVSVGLMVALIPFVPAQYTERLATLKDFLPGSETSAVEEVSFSGRLSENISAVMMFRDHPILGVGLENYKTNYQSYSRQLGLDSRREERSPHSMYLEIASQMGLVGLFWLGGLQWITFRGLWRARTQFLEMGRADLAGICWAIAFGLISYLVMGIFLHLYEMRYFWLIYGIALSVPLVAAHERANANLSPPHVPSANIDVVNPHPNPLPLGESNGERERNLVGF